ncbi:SDR family oxidoreductase [Sinobaca sp. H24]|uniref:SDR family oxidoreductase n=1 Tax=Sinobaca sp. H24 TaxID=2923376 RepID=UPI00207986AD|nr:SDR family oxidoreductase [Sinobaca sp. H24]
MEFKEKQQDGQPVQQQNRQPGEVEPMDPKPVHDNPEYKGSDKLKDKTALITGGDSGIGKAAAIAYAKEGADVAIVYLDEHEDAEQTKKEIENYGRRCLLLPGDGGDDQFAKKAVENTIKEFGQLDVLINNAAEQHPQEKIEDISKDQLEKTFRTNVFSMFYFIQAALPHLKEGAAIINTTSVTAYDGSAGLIDYSATNGAVTTLIRSLSTSLASKGIRVNGVAPGPIWTPLIPSTFGEDKVESFGTNTPMGRPGQPAELAPAFVLLGSQDSSYMTGQVIHVNGGRFVTT